ncbi:MAG: CBS domain-containing protein [Dehalococcoidales bacterium]|nr:CBS domain-containing protein [Dehalococcoidales bacterium]
MSRIINFKIHYSWIPVFALITVILTTQFSESYPLWQRVVLGLAVSLLFLAAVAVREIIVRAVSSRQPPTERILLFAFGGVNDEVRNSLAAAHQPMLYLVRFSSSLLIAIVFYGLYATFITTDNMVMAALAQWLAYLFFLLFLLHLIPVFPLEGGRVLRTALWKSSGDYHKATYKSSLIGQAAGLFFIFAGVLVFIITRQWMVSLIIVSTGWILHSAAGYTRHQARTLMLLRNIKAQDIMTREYPVMPRQANLGQLVREHILVKGWPYVIVADSSGLKGMLTLDQIKSVPYNRWNNTAIGDIMTPCARLRTAHLQQPAAALLEEMLQRGIDHIPVLEGENLVGVVNRVALLSLVKTRIGFGA